MREMRDRTEQDLLAERRANVLESMRSNDRTTQENLGAHIAIIDAELDRRRKEKERRTSESETSSSRRCSPSDCRCLLP